MDEGSKKFLNNRFYKVSPEMEVPIREGDLKVILHQSLGKIDCKDEGIEYEGVAKDLPKDQSKI